MSGKPTHNISSNINAKVIKIPYDIKVGNMQCFLYFVFSDTRWSLFSFVQQSHFQARKLLPFHTWVDSHSDLLIQRVKKKSIQTHKPLFLFWRETNFFFFSWKMGWRGKKGKERNHSKQMFCDSQLHSIHSGGDYYPIICGFSCIILSVYFTIVALFIFALIILELV